MKAIIPGSFDPITTGHEDIIKRVSENFDSVTVLVCENENKTPMFTLDERLEIARNALSYLENVTVEKHKGFLYEYLLREEGVVIVKGVRNKEDFEYEKEMAKFNYEKSRVETLLIFASDKNSEISSTVVRRNLSEYGDFSTFIPQNAQKTVKKFYK